MAYNHVDKARGQLIPSSDWNTMGHEIMRLDSAKVNRAGDTITGSLSVSATVGIGVPAGNESLEISGNLKINGDRLKNAQGLRILQTNASDWLRINSDGDFPATALYGPLAVGTAGLSVGDWSIMPPGQLKVTGLATLGALTVSGNAGIGTSAAPAGKLEVVGKVAINNGSGYAVKSNNMADGSLTIGGTNASYGGGAKWNANVAGLLMETQRNTEIAVHDADTRIASLLYYEGKVDNRLTIGRDMGWGGLNQVRVNAQLQVANSDIYFTKTDHNYTGLGNAAGNAAIENAASYDALMILGRSHPGQTPSRIVKLWDYLEVVGNLQVSGAHLQNASGFSIVQTNANDWLRINPDEQYPAVAIFNPVAIGTGGLSVGDWSQVPAGALRVTGNAIILGNLGTHGFSPLPHTTGWGGGIHTFDVEAEGTIWSRSAFQSGNRDVAEQYASDLALEAGDVVRLDPDKDGILLSDQSNDPLVLGVISSNPGVHLNVNHDGEQHPVFPVALCGRVPCKVNTENGPIRRGDLLTTSSTPGQAMKARPAESQPWDGYHAGTIIGKALGSIETGEGTIEVFVFLR